LGFVVGRPSVFWEVAFVCGVWVGFLGVLLVWCCGFVFLVPVFWVFVVGFVVVLCFVVFVLCGWGFVCFVLCPTPPSLECARG
jgi:hypothetical protein